MYSNKNLYTNVHSSTIHNGQKVETTRCPSTNEWIYKMWYNHAMEYYSAIDRNEVLMHAINWINSGNFPGGPIVDSVLQMPGAWV